MLYSLCRFHFTRSRAFAPQDVSWDENDELGKGTFGVVYRGLYKWVLTILER